MEYKEKKTWQNGEAKDITFIVTEECQLSCKYCYESNKKRNSMTFQKAKKIVNYCLSDDVSSKNDYVVWNFIGGEPLLEIELINDISEYIKTQTRLLDHKWQDNYKFAIVSNGLMYNDKRVKEYINQNRWNLSFTISIDGTKEKHNMQRVYENGKGSFDDVISNVKNWVNDFHFTATKATISHSDLSLIKESVLFLYSLGINDVYMNVVYEDVWEKGDPDIFKEQLIELADEIIDNELYKYHTCTLFDNYIGNPIPSSMTTNWCGTGNMLAFDHDGNIYPCLRFHDFSLTDRPKKTLGNVDTGIDKNKLRPFELLNRKFQSDDECNNCMVASGCGWCQAHNYELSKEGTINFRSHNICEMHKARVKANNYYWSKLYLALSKKEEIK